VDEPGGELKPRPDPTVLTTAALLREIEHLRELVEAKIDGHASFSSRRYDDLSDLLEYRAEANAKLFALHLDEARQQLQDQIDATQRATDAALLSTTKAIDKAEAAIEKRFESVNEFRAQLTDQSSTFLRRDMFDQHVREAREALQVVQTQAQTNHAQLLTISSTETGGRDREAQARANMATWFAAVATLVAVATLIMALVTTV
jgi:hypothetical protein